jgi:hypothetical protein
MNSTLEEEIERLRAVARVHALTVLSRPADQHERYLARYRLVWAQYALAFSKNDAERQTFVDALDRATRDMMLEIGSTDVAMWRRATDRWVAQTLAADTPVEPRHSPGDVITLEQLRPILRKIIGN